MPDPSSPRHPTVVIVGGGLSGTLVAATLLRRGHGPLHIILIERRFPVGRGVAYGTTCPGHLLNVPASRMSLWPDAPDHFVDWLRARRGAHDAPVDPAAFLPRWLYGDYVADTLAAARAAAPPDSRFEEIEAEAMDVEEDAEGGVVHLADGRTIRADRVVLAVGNLPGEYPINRALPVYRSSRYVHVPSNHDALDGIGADDDVLLVGQGLTAVDLIVQLEQRGHRGITHALSRRGVQPQVHRPSSPWAWPASTQWPSTIRGLVRHVRAHVREAHAGGGDWRGVIDGLRPHAQQLWQRLSWTERARFLRHVRPFWEIHRHRLAPEVAAIVDARAAAGRLLFHAGRLQVLDEDAGGVYARFRRRGTSQHMALRVAKVINCTGPRTDYSKYEHPLFTRLLARGLIDHDPLALGIRATPEGEVLRYRGARVGWLYTLGAPLKSDLWECTAVPEIRVQAQALATLVLGSLAHDLTAARQPR